ADRNRSHWSTSKTPSYTKSVSWQHHRYNEENKRQKLIPTPSEDALKQMVDDKKERLKGPL
ncbi:conjugal transfer protein TraG, partial [Escherichia coli]|uniref:conjugal transfer protein TraG n=1 Tax=Escherichia coli TaxID=562 RepID=UPI001BC85AB3